MRGWSGDCVGKSAGRELSRMCLLGEKSAEWDLSWMCMSGVTSLSWMRMFWR